MGGTTEPWRHPEHHRTRRLGGLRAAVLGADDGIVSAASLVLGVAASSASGNATLVAGIAGLVAGSMSMAAGEWVSVSSQHDAEQAALALERSELADDPVGELAELEALLIRRGLRPGIAAEAAKDLSATDALSAHAVEELGITAEGRARPGQAALASAASFAIGAAVPLAAIALAPSRIEAVAVGVASVIALGVLGAAGARAGGASVTRATAWVVLGGSAAMALTALIGRLTISLGL